MQEPYWWYVLYVRSNTEHRVVESFQQTFRKKGLQYEVDVFCPESEKFYNNKKSRILGRQYLRRPMVQAKLLLNKKSAFALSIY